MPDAKVGLFLQDDDLGEDAEKGVRQFLDDQIVDGRALHLRQHRRGPADRRPPGAKADLVLAFNTPSYTALAQLVS